MFAALAAPLAAQGNGATAGVLLELPGSSRQMAFQGAYAAVVGDEGSIFVNPAGMAPIHRTAMGVTYERSAFGTRLSSGAAALRVGRFDAGLGVMYLDFGGDSVIVPDPAFGGDRGLATGQVITAYNALAVGALAYRRGMISLGGSVKYLREQIGSGSSPYAAHGVTGDLGLAIAVFDIMAIGAVVQNVGGSLSNSTGTRVPMPRTTRLGFTINFIDPQGTARFMTTVDWVNPPGGDSYAAFGFEGGIVAGGVGLVGRAGIAAGRAPGDRQPFSFGGGIVVKSVRLDYAWQGYETLGQGSHRFGLRWVP